MTYAEYLNFYGLEKTNDTFIDWLYNEHHHGRAYQYEGEFYSIETGKKIGGLQINQDKVKEYLKDEMIMEFDSADECLDYFNTYDSQDFKSVVELKAFQGKYGFGIGEKWYHICYDKALDVWELSSLSTQIDSAASKTANLTSQVLPNDKTQER